MELILCIAAFVVFTELGEFIDIVQGWGARPYAGCKFTESLRKVQQQFKWFRHCTHLQTFCTHKNVLTIFQQKLHLLVNSD